MSSDISGAPGAERGGSAGPGDAEPSLDHVLRNAAEARAVPEGDEE